MGNITSILQTAQDRSKSLKLSYEGALLPQEAYQLLQLAPAAKLVDVRTRAELDWVGGVPGAILIEWANYPGMKPNQHFIAQLEQQVDKESLVIFLCRSGVRSHHAAAAATLAGYTDCFNVIGGFEGDKNSDKRRNTLNGWRVAGLPWEQG
jgi:rhodanese-related sulfurtransferase